MYAEKKLVNISANEKRKHKRVNIALKGAICLPGRTIEVVKTKNISENGIAIEHKTSLKPIPGNTIKIHINGIICSETECDNSQRTSNFYTMKVARVSGDTIGLVF